MKYFSMFSGVGGFELGIQRAYDNRRDASAPTLATGHSSVSTISDGARRRSHATCVGYSEIDKYAIETYQHNFKGHTNYGDATTIDPADLPDFELLVGGFPCQAFSVAGKRLGFNETRGTLFFDIARILSHKRPRHLVLENVKGLLSHDSGKTFSTIIGVLTDLGYLIEWQVLNAKDFGVPQNRERVFIVGHLGGKCRHQIFPLTRHNHEAAFGTIHSSYHKGQHTGSYVETAPALRASDHKRGDNQTVVAEINVVGELNNETWSKRHESIRRVHGTDGISPTIPTGTDGGVMTKIAVRSAATRTRKYAGKPETLEVRPDKISNTINSVTKDYYATDMARIRRLTPVECERLMSWPDGWTLGSDTQRYKQCGNGVVSNCVQAVIEALYMA